MFQSSNKITPVFLLACGSFNPPTIMHLRLFEVARDHLESLPGSCFKVLGGIISSVNDKYGKAGLASSKHRNNMIRLALKSYSFTKLSTWESEVQQEWTRSRKVLDKHKNVLDDFVHNHSERPEWVNENLSREDVSGARILLLMAFDVLESFSIPGLWSEDDIKTICKDYGMVVLTRGNATAGEEIVQKSELLSPFKNNIHHVLSDMGTDISSTKVRRCVKENKSIRFIVNDDVIEYIKENDLYR